MMMRNILIVLLSLILCVSCDKVPMNGDLDGMWQLMRVEDENGAKDVKADKLYMSFQLHLVQFDGKNDKGNFQSRLYYAHFKHEGDSLFIYDLSYNSQNATSEDNNEWFTDADLYKLKPWGIYSLDSRYKVLKLNSDAMVLRHEDLVLTYRKF